MHGSLLLAQHDIRSNLKLLTLTICVRVCLVCAFSVVSDENLWIQLCDLNHRRFVMNAQSSHLLTEYIQCELHHPTDNSRWWCYAVCVYFSWNPLLHVNNDRIARNCLKVNRIIMSIAHAQAHLNEKPWPYTFRLRACFWWTALMRYAERTTEKRMKKLTVIRHEHTSNSDWFRRLTKICLLSPSHFGFVQIQSIV